MHRLKVDALVSLMGDSLDERFAVLRDAFGCSPKQAAAVDDALHRAWVEHDPVTLLDIARDAIEQVIPLFNRVEGGAVPVDVVKYVRAVRERIVNYLDSRANGSPRGKDVNAELLTALKGLRGLFGPGNGQADPNDSAEEVLRADAAIIAAERSRLL